MGPLSGIFVTHTKVGNATFGTDGQDVGLMIQHNADSMLGKYSPKQISAAVQVDHIQQQSPGFAHNHTPNSMLNELNTSAPNKKRGDHQFDFNV